MIYKTEQFEISREDNMELMARYPDNYFDLAIVDPPYGIDFAKTHTGNGWIVRENKTWDKQRPPKEYWGELYRISKNQIIWGANYMVEHLKASMGWVFWDKGQRDFSLADGELAYTSFQKALRVFTMARGKHKAADDKIGGKVHPTQKPVALYEWLFKNYAKEGDKILDTHMGSMSIAIALHNMNEKDGMNLSLVGCELDPEYYKDGIKRVRNAVAQKTIFSGLG